MRCKGIACDTHYAIYFVRKGEGAIFRKLLLRKNQNRMIILNSDLILNQLENWEGNHIQFSSSHH